MEKKHTDSGKEIVPGTAVSKEGHAEGHWKHETLVLISLTKGATVKRPLYCQRLRLNSL